jgi:hypothetical protein
MFSKEDYLACFQDLEGVLAKQSLLLKDILNEVSDRTIHSKLHAIFLDDKRIFEEAMTQKKKFED